MPRAAIRSFTVKGSWREMGRAVGHVERQEIHSVLLARIFPPTDSPLLKKQILLFKHQCPQEWEHLLGMSEGAGQTVETMLSFLSWEDVLKPGEHCSTFLGKQDRHWVIGHNEDDAAHWHEKLFLIKYVPSRGSRLLALQYAGQFPGSSMAVTEHGFALTMDTIWPRWMPLRTGWPISFVGLRLLQSRSWKDVLATYRRVQVNQGMHFLMVQNARAVSLEFFPQKKARREVKSGFVHTNHALLPTLQTLSGRPSKSSRERLTHLQAYATRSHAASFMLKGLLTPCDQGGAKRLVTPKDDTMTLATCLLTPARREIHLIEPQNKKFQL